MTRNEAEKRRQAARTDVTFEIVTVENYHVLYGLVIGRTVASDTDALRTFNQRLQKLDPFFWKGLK